MGYQNVFQHMGAMNFAGLAMLIGFSLFMLGAVPGVVMAAREAKRIKAARAAGEEIQKRPAPRRRLLIPALVAAELAIIATPVLYAATVSQPQTVSAMQANVKQKYGADLELPKVGPNQKLMQASSPDKPEDYILTFPDGSTSTDRLRFDPATSEPFILNDDGSVRDPAGAAGAQTGDDTTGAVADSPSAEAAP